MAKSQQEVDEETRHWLNTTDTPIVRFLNNEDVKHERAKFDAWPFCYKCMRPVRAYGWDVHPDEGKPHVQIWARCHGQMQRSLPIPKPSAKPSAEWRKQILRAQIFFR